MKIKHYTAAFLLTCFILSTFSNATTSATSNNTTIDVIVGFTDTADPKVITENNGIIHEIYTIIPAIYVSLPQTAIENLKDNPKIAYIEENSKLKTCAYTTRWATDHINATHAWSQSTGQGVKIAVLDTGVGPVNDITVYGGYNFIDNNSNYADNVGHGTMVAGIIAASHSSPLGVAGVAPSAEIYSVKILDNSFDGEVSYAISGVQWAVNNGMQIISMSWTINDENYALGQALQAAYDQGILLVAAAGNAGNQQTGVGCPASYAPVIAVSAIDQNNVRLGDSGDGPEIELAAPGESIYSVGRDNSLWVGSGTSYAAAFVSGTAALVWARNPSLTNVQVRQILDETAVDLQPADGLERDIFYGYGLVNASAAVSATPKNSNVDFSWSPNKIYTEKQVNFDASSSFGGVSGYTKYEWSFSDGTTQTENSPFTTHAYTNEGSYSVTLTVSNNFGFSNSKTQTISVLEDNIAPLTSHNYDGELHTSAFTIILTVQDDASGVNQTYYRINDDAIKTVSIDGQPVINTNSLNNKLEYWSIDNAGNQETHKTLTDIKLDTTPPSTQPTTSATQTQPTPTNQIGIEQYTTWIVIAIISVLAAVILGIFIWRKRR